MNNLVFSHVDDNELIREIDLAKGIVVLYVPGIGAATARALHRPIWRLKGAGEWKRLQKRGII